jgi:hypothetical protein
VLVSVSFFHCEKIHEQNHLKEKDLFWLMLSEVSVHHGGEDRVRQSSSPHGHWEAEGK